jgi:uncharacterized protein (DUF1800 family)
VDDKHSPEEEQFLRKSIPAGTGGSASSEMAIDTLFNHPNVGPFIGRQLIQRLVTSNLSPAYIARLARVFNDNGKGVWGGSMKAVIDKVFRDPEPRSPLNISASASG